jgi:hypothetical protein
LIINASPILPSNNFATFERHPFFGWRRPIYRGWIIFAIFLAVLAALATSVWHVVGFKISRVSEWPMTVTGARTYQEVSIWLSNENLSVSWTKLRLVDDVKPLVSATGARWRGVTIWEPSTPPSRAPVASALITDGQTAYRTWNVLGIVIHAGFTPTPRNEPRARYDLFCFSCVLPTWFVIALLSLAPILLRRSALRRRPRARGLFLKG